MAGAVPRCAGGVSLQSPSVSAAFRVALVSGTTKSQLPLWEYPAGAGGTSQEGCFSFLPRAIHARSPLRVLALTRGLPAGLQPRAAALGRPRAEKWDMEPKAPRGSSCPTAPGLRPLLERGPPGSQTWHSPRGQDAAR